MREDPIKNEGRMPLPVKLTFEPTARCNLECMMCERHKPLHSTEKELSLAEIERFADKIKGVINSAYISGGEPLVRKDIIEICRAFQNRGISFSLQTNGTFVERTRELLILPFYLILSLDGPAQVHDRIRGFQGAFEKNMEIIRMLKGRKFTVTTVIQRANLNFLPDFADELEKLHPDLVIFELARSYTEEARKATMEILGVSLDMLNMHIKEGIIPQDLAVFEETIRILKKKVSKASYSKLLMPSDLFEDPVTCILAKRRQAKKMMCTHLEELRVDSRGEIIPCFAIRKSFGNVKKDRIIDVWNRKDYREYRLKLLSSNLTPLCDSCYRAIPMEDYLTTFEGPISLIPTLRRCAIRAKGLLQWKTI